MRPSRSRRSIAPSPESYVARLRKAPERVVAGALVLALGAQVALLARHVLIPLGGEVAADVVRAPPRSDADVVAIGRLFGVREAAAGPAASGSAASAQLIGTIAFGDGEGVALLQVDGGVARAFRVGARVRDGFELLKVYADRVLLGTSLDTATVLRLPRSALASAMLAAFRADGAGEVEEAEPAEDSAERRAEKAQVVRDARFANTVAVATPAVLAGDDVQGIAIERSGSLAAMRAAGLRPGDFITHVAGLPVSSPGAARRLNEALVSGERVAVTAVRDNAAVELTINAPDAPH